jgi:hypothetical protein
MSWLHQSRSIRRKEASSYVLIGIAIAVLLLYMLWS